MGGIKELVDQVWEAFDKDGNGVLAGSEYENFIKVLCSKQHSLAGKDEEMKELFDQNGDN